MTDMLLKVEGLRTWIGGNSDAVRAVDGVDIAIRKGETFALLGESGCGKSMTAQSILRLLPESADVMGGSVKLHGEELLALPEMAMRQIRGKRIAMIFQEPQTSLNPVLTVGQQITEALKFQPKQAGVSLRNRALELLDAVGIPDPEQRYDAYPHQLSGGMKQRVMIAVALAGEPELLIADEPTTALDVTIQAQVLELLRELQQKTGMAILLITHDLGVVAEMAHRIAVMYAGEIVEQADREAFFTSPRHPYSRMLFEALPTRDKRVGQLAVIQGNVPALNQVFKGCRFASRCRAVIPQCEAQPVAWQEEQGHGVRCLRAKELSEDAFSTGEISKPVTEAPSKLAESSLLSVHDLQVYFPITKGLFQRVVGQVKAVDGVSLELHRGRTLALVGESGCGKTTAGKAMLQLLRPTGGSVEMDGVELSALSERRLQPYRGKLQFIFQDPVSSMNPRMRVEDILAEGMCALGMAGDATARVNTLLEQVGLSAEHRLRYPHEFSGGQRQRLSIARALAVEPEIIICDEPTSALDVSVQAQILNLLKQLQKERQLSYLFITHNLAVVEYLAHEVAVMYLGRIVEQGDVESVMSQPRHPYTQALLSAMPRIIEDTERPVIRLEGELPSPSNPPQGCHFHPRCAHAMPVCREQYPACRQCGTGHAVNCFLYEE